MTKILIVLLCTTILATSSVKSSIHHKYEAVTTVRKQKPENTQEITRYIVNQWRRKYKRHQVAGTHCFKPQFFVQKLNLHFSEFDFNFQFHEEYFFQIYENYDFYVH